MSGFLRLRFRQSRERVLDGAACSIPSVGPGVQVKRAIWPANNSDVLTEIAAAFVRCRTPQGVSPRGTHHHQHLSAGGGLPHSDARRVCLTDRLERATSHTWSRPNQRLLFGLPCTQACNGLASAPLPAGLALRADVAGTPESPSLAQPGHCTPGCRSYRTGAPSCSCGEWLRWLLAYIYSCIFRAK